MKLSPHVPQPLPPAVTGASAGPGAGKALVLFLLVALLLRAPGFPASVLDPDEGLYLIQAEAWLRGSPPYLGVWDMHPPGAPGLIALLHALVPWPLAALRGAGVLAVSATALALFGVMRVLGGGHVAALAAGMLYIAHTTVLGGLATNTELLFAPFIGLCALLLLAEAQRVGPPRFGVVLVAGLSAGIALWVKQVAAVEASALWLTMVAVAWSQGRLGFGRMLLLALLFAVGAATPMVASGVAYWLMGALDTFLYSNVAVLFGYSVAEDGSPGLRRGLAMALPHLVWLGAAAGLAATLPGQAQRAAWLVLPWLAAALIQALAPGKGYDHYFLILLPPLSLLAALGLARAVRQMVRPEARGAAFAGLVLAVAALPVTQMMAPRLANGFGLRLMDAPKEVALRVAAAGESLWVANWHPIVYALAGRLPPTPYAFPTHLSGFHAPLTGVDYDAELARVLAQRPEVIVVSPSRWWLVRPEAREAIETTLADGYTRIAEVQDGAQIVEVWRRQ